MRVILIWLTIGCGGAPLAPGQTRCTTTPAFGSSVTECETGQARPHPIAQPTEARERGFFCAASDSDKSADICAREKASCVIARDAAMGALPDLGNCVLIETAWCFSSKRCTITPDACNAQRERAHNDGHNCTETK